MCAYTNNRAAEKGSTGHCLGMMHPACGLVLVQDSSAEGTIDSKVLRSG